jgi:hypothetical protein
MGGALHGARPFYLRKAEKPNALHRHNIKTVDEAANLLTRIVVQAGENFG